VGYPHLHFDDCEIDATAFELRRAGQVCDVEPQVLELLLYLARHPDQLITKNDLIREVWNGRIVSDSTLASRIKSARRAIGDDGEHQRRIKTVHGRGVRFIGEGASSAEKKIAAAPDWPSVAVLPFANVSDDPEQNYFVDGLTEDIITDLSRFGHLRVVARGSCFQYRDFSGDLQKVCRALGADYIVMGSVRRRGAQIRLSAQLMAAESPNQLWAERFDRGTEDVFAVADELVGTIAATLAGRVRQAGSALAKRKPPANLAAYECVLRAHAALVATGDDDNKDDIRRLFEQALISDPDYPRAHAGLAIVLVREWYRDSNLGQAALDLALHHAQRAVALDSHDNECQETLGWVLLQRRQFDLCEQHYHRAIELNPHSPDELAAMGSACSYLGRPSEGIGWFELAKRIDPFFDPPWYWNLLGVCYFTARRYDEAIAAFDHCAITPGWVIAYAAASHALAGRLDAARDQAAKLRRDWPDFSIEIMVRKEPYKNPTDHAHLVEGLIRAGLLTSR
jgi:TolB-like protein